MTELTHYGVKGMKWGVVRAKARSINEARKAETAVQIKEKNGDFVKSSGGRNRRASSDAVETQVYRQIARQNTTDQLSNVELQRLVTRMNLEQQYNNLATQQDRRSKGQKLAHKLLGGSGKTLAVTLAGKKGESFAAGVERAFVYAEGQTAGPSSKKK